MLRLMRRWHHYAWLLGSLAVLATLLALQPRSGDLRAESATCASPPSLPRASFESAHDAAGLQQRHFGGFDSAFLSTSLSLGLVGAHTGQQPNQPAIASNPFYGSLFRRPPPSLS